MKKTLINLLGLLFLGLLLGTVIGKIEKASAPPELITGDYKKYFTNSKIRIKLFGENNCIFCNRLKEFLDRNEIDYIYANVKENANLMKEFKELGGTGVPLTIVGNSLIQGFNEEVIKVELLKLGYQIK
jgi:glutaredoxin